MSRAKHFFHININLVYTRVCIFDRYAEKMWKKNVNWPHAWLSVINALAIVLFISRFYSPSVFKGTLDWTRLVVAACSLMKGARVNKVFLFFFLYKNKDKKTTLQLNHSFTEDTARRETTQKKTERRCTNTPESLFWYFYKSHKVIFPAMRSVKIFYITHFYIPNEERESDWFNSNGHNIYIEWTYNIVWNFYVFLPTVIKWRASFSHTILRNTLIGLKKKRTWFRDCAFLVVAIKLRMNNETSVTRLRTMWSSSAPRCA